MLLPTTLLPLERKDSQRKQKSSFLIPLERIMTQREHHWEYSIFFLEKVPFEAYICRSRALKLLCGKIYEKTNMAYNL